MEMDKKKLVGFNQLNFATASGVDTTAIFGFVLLKPVPVAGSFFFSTLFAIWESKEVRPPWKNYIRLPICSLSNILLMSNTTFDVLILVTVVARHVVAEEITSGCLFVRCLIYF